ncbi:MAG TPA: CDC27 family protein [Sulfuricurvum sp.]|nr:CDC27 family protein [Sulfuricurvum sp.]
MLDIISLERRWLKYKIKSYLPHFILSIAAVAIIITLFMSFSSGKRDVQTIETKPSTVLQKSPSLNPSENDMILEPSMQFIQSMSPNIQSDQPIHTSSKPLPPKTVAVPKTPLLATPVQVISITTPSAPMTPPPSIVKPKTPAMKLDSSAFDIHEIEERFRVNSNPHLGVYIARYHYEHGNYNEAYNYALKTNSISNTMEESWLIFAKSLVKLGKNDQAKKTLQLYISQSNSENAKSLLYSIQQGGVK